MASAQILSIIRIDGSRIQRMRRASSQTQTASQPEVLGASLPVARTQPKCLTVIEAGLTRSSAPEKKGALLSPTSCLGSACHTAGRQIPAEWQPCDAGE